MKIINHKDTPLNKLGIPGAKNVNVRLLIGADDGAPNFIMLLLEIAPRGNTPDHAHPWEEEIFIEAGHGVIKTKDGEKRVSSGDVIFLAPNEWHQFVNNGYDNLELICIIPRRK